MGYTTYYFGAIPPILSVLGYRAIVLGVLDVQVRAKRTLHADVEMAPLKNGTALWELPGKPSSSK